MDFYFSARATQNRGGTLASRTAAVDAPETTVLRENYFHVHFSVRSSKNDRSGERTVRYGGGEAQYLH